MQTPKDLADRLERLAEEADTERSGWAECIHNGKDDTVPKAIYRRLVDKRASSAADLRAAAAAVRALDVAATSLKRVVRKADRQLSSECAGDAIVLVQIITECKYASDTIAAAKKGGA